MALTGGLPIPPDLADWLLVGLKMLHAGTADSLDEALGLDPTPAKARKAQRNTHLKSIANAMAGTPGSLAARIARGDVPADVKPLLTLANSCYRIPSSTRQLERIVNRGTKAPQRQRSLAAHH